MDCSWRIVLSLFMCINYADGMVTFDGDAGGAECVIPFIANGKAYFSCTSDGGDPEYPYCYTTNPGKWGYCATTDCKLTPKGHGYIGTRTTHDDGGPCDDWSTYSWPITDFPDSTYADAGFFCRNPDSDTDLWCFKIPWGWAFCSGVPMCTFCDTYFLSGSGSIVTPGDYSASGVRDAGHPAAGATLNSASAWCAAVDDANQYVQVDLLSVERIEGIITQGEPGEASWTTSYKLSYSDDGVIFTVFQVGGTDKVFTGNVDQNTHVAYLLDFAIFARYVRILPVTFNSRVCLRFEVVGCTDPNDCIGVDCKNGGTCIDYPQTPGYECQCADGYTGPHCEFGTYESCVEVVEDGHTASMYYSLTLYASELPSECLMTYMAEVTQSTGVLFTYSVSISEDNCQAMCQVESACVAVTHTASSCQLFSTIDRAFYTVGHKYYVKSCPNTHLIYCDLTDPANPVTHIETSLTGSVHVPGWGGVLTNPVAVQYFPVGMHQMQALQDHSVDCIQSLQLDCLAATARDWGWVTADTLYPFEDASSMLCQCRLDYACTDLGLTTCACIANDAVWRMDRGILSGEQVPIIAVLVGDTENAGEDAYFEVGSFICTQTANPCSVDPCLNGGTCENGGGVYVCNCTAGYTGRECQTDIYECGSLPCQNGATCVDGVNSYTCQCLPDHTGDHCEHGVVCTSDPCMNDGSCVDGITSYTCLCREGFTGTHCEIDINECSSGPCLNGATCVDGPARYDCLCATGFTGTDCETDLNECDPDPCLISTNCVDQPGDYDCICLAGYTGKNCETEIDECGSIPCQNNGTCLDEYDNFLCFCDIGYTGLMCETEVDECLSTPCQNNGTCIDQLNGFSCNCTEGYTGELCQSELNECDSDPCLNDGRCTDEIAGYTCTCVAGFTGNHCETDLDDCTPDHCHNGTCVDLVNDFQCNCFPDYTGVLCDMFIADGAFGAWQAWSGCSEPCGVGVQTRLRECDDPLPQNGGLECNWTVAAEIQFCNGNMCAPIDGGWTGWTDWSICSQSCGFGEQLRLRQCINPMPANGGLNCVGPSTDVIACFREACDYPVDGSWSGWTYWSECSALCNTGSQVRIRQCNNPSPEHGGQYCDGIYPKRKCETRPCHEKKCPAYGDCDHWQTWSKCSKTCGDGSHTRWRTCRLTAQERREWTLTTEEGTTELALDQELKEYEHAHCQDQPCGVHECYHCGSEHDGTVESLSCKGPSRECPDNEPYCVHTLQKSGQLHGVTKRCGSEQFCNATVTGVCKHLRDAAVNSIVSYDSASLYPLEPSWDSILQVWTTMVDGDVCSVCCSKSRCNLGMLPPANTVVYVEDTTTSGGYSWVQNTSWTLSIIVCGCILGLGNRQVH